MLPRRPAFALCLAALCWTAACAPAPVAPPTATPAPVTAAALAAPPTRAAQLVPSQTVAPTEPPSPTLPPTLTPRAATATIPNPAFQSDPFVPRAPEAGPGDTVIGLSAGGRPIVARRFGEGSRVLVLVGGIHGGYEQNTVALAERLAAHFAAQPQDIPAGWSVVIIPAANPDGLLRGQSAEGRFNSRGVDLNRNWSCDWSADAVWRETPVNPGAGPLSEPETQALADTLLRLRPEAVLFFHSKAGAVYAGDCVTGPPEIDSAQLAAVYGEASGYAYGQSFSAYTVTGTAASWADGQGFYSADVELETSNLAEFDVNLRAVLAALAWLQERQSQVGS